MWEDRRVFYASNAKTFEKLEHSVKQMKPSGDALELIAPRCD